MSIKALQILFSIIFLLIPLKAIAQQCEELKCDIIYDKCKVEAELENDYRCVRALIPMEIVGFCDKKSKDYSACIKQVEKKVKEFCLKELEEEYKICKGIYETCKEMQKEQCKKLSADKFPKALNVTISRNCHWETDGGGNITTTTSYSFNIQGVVQLKERKKDFVRYESKNLTANYHYKSIGIMKNPSDKCFGKIVERVKGEGSASAHFILDIYIGELAKFTEEIRKGKIPAQKDLKQSGSKGIYDFIGHFAGNFLIESTDESPMCELKVMGQAPWPGAFAKTHQPLFSTGMVGILRSSEVGPIGSCPDRGYFMWNFSPAPKWIAGIPEGYGISLSHINYVKDRDLMIFELENINEMTVEPNIFALPEEYKRTQVFKNRKNYLYTCKRVKIHMRH